MFWLHLPFSRHKKDILRKENFTLQANFLTDGVAVDYITFCKKSVLLIAVLVADESTTPLSLSLLQPIISWRHLSACVRPVTVHIINTVFTAWCYTQSAVMPHYVHRLSLCDVQACFYRASAYLALQRAVLAMIDSVWPTVRPSDRLSHAGIMPKRLQLRSCGFRWRIAPWLYFPDG